jgi:cytochrome o ubiquinol oxidase operon protein cyoD
MAQHTSELSAHGASHGSLKSYSVGFVLSILLTLGAYLTVTHHAFSTGGLMAVVVWLAIIQLITQLVFFLHLDKGSGRRWNLLALGLASIVVLILVIGSLWIMSNLNYHMMSGVEIDQYTQSQEAIQK